MTDEMNFFLFLIERYARHKGMPTGEILKKWDELDLTQKIFDGYTEYHQERIENAFEDIESLMKTGLHAW